MDMQHTASDRLEMNIKWIVMRAMFVFDIGMLYNYINMHKRIQTLKVQLKN